MRELKEIVLGRGDYVAGGARSLPFLDQDGARRRRPMVLGEVRIEPPEDPVLESMFSGRASDPIEWGVMWKEIGADGICLRLGSVSEERAVELAATLSERTRLPLMIDGDAVDAVGAGISDSVLILLDGEPCGMHSPAIRIGSVSDTGSAYPDRVNRAFYFETAYPSKDRFDLMCEVRRRALEGDERCDAPMIADVTSSYPPGSDAREASMREGIASLAAMSAGADIVIVRGPGAADMARVYGEELADL